MTTTALGTRTTRDVDRYVAPLDVHDPAWLHKWVESIDGPRYSEAIRGANAMRTRAFTIAAVRVLSDAELIALIDTLALRPGTTYHRLSGPAWTWEREQGLPEGWITRP